MLLQAANLWAQERGTVSSKEEFARKVRSSCRADCERQWHQRSKHGNCEQDSAECDRAQAKTFAKRSADQEECSHPARTMRSFRQERLRPDVAVQNYVARIGITPAGKYFIPECIREGTKRSLSF